MEANVKAKGILVTLLVSLVVVIVGGLLWFFFLGPQAPVGIGWYMFSFTAGLTMIVLPCTLPLAFVIVPLSMGKGAIKGLAMAIFFGLGVSLMLSTYGILAAVVGKVAIGSLGAPLEVVKNWLYFIAGALAYLFALGELGFIKFRMPTYTGAAPAFIQKQQDFLKAFFLGIFLGNIGVGCPHPATPVLLTRIAVSGDIFYGWLLFFVHAVGRILPLMVLAILGILGINALTWLVARKDKVERATGWGMVFVAAFILVLGLFSHDWWVYSGQHTLLEEFTREEQFLGAVIARLKVAGAPHAHGMPTGTGLFGLPLALGNWVLVALWMIPVWWAVVRKRAGMTALPPDEQKIESAVSPFRWGFALLATLAAITLFVFVLPDRFLLRTQDHSAMHGPTGDMMHPPDSQNQSQTHMVGTSMDHTGHAALSHEEGDITTGLAVNFRATPASPSAGRPAQYRFSVVDRPTNTPVTNLEINHEKFMHVIGVRDDMSQFFHIHPGSTSTRSGEFTMAHTIANPGRYKLWSEVTQGGITHSIGHPPFAVAGTGEKYKKDIAFTTSVIADSYQVVLNYQGTIAQKRDTSLSFEIHDAQGKEVELENYLGVSMHLALIKDDWKVFLHVHPEDGTAHAHALLPSFVRRVYADEGHAHPTGEQHGVGFHVTFPEPGIYKAYAQFRPKGIVLPPDQAITASFWIQVEEKAPPVISQWWFLLGVSCIAIAILSWVTHKFITVAEVAAKPKETV